MTNTDKPIESQGAVKGGFSGRQVLAFILITILITLGTGFFVVKYYVFARPFTPVVLNSGEEKVLNEKLSRLGQAPAHQAQNNSDAVKPEPYSEAGADRSITLTERELNAILARNTDLATKLAIDLSDKLMSANAIIPLDDDFPFLGGQTLRVKSGIAITMIKDRPSLVLQGVSVMGVPLPNAWLGGLKNVDLIEEFGKDSGFWQAFAAGVEHIDVEDGKLNIRLKE